jgi:hypothetical protein
VSLSELQLIAAIKRLRETRGELGLLDGKFKQQDNFVEDKSMFVGAQCTRRAGKSNGIGKRLFKKAKKYPKSIVPYIALTRESAKNIMWPVFHEINDKYHLGAELTDSNLTVTLPNQARIVCFGADMKNFINRLRGPKYPEAAVDEAQSFGTHIKELIDDILTPAVSDFEDGAITVTGTPGPVTAGYFYDLCHGKEGYSLHKWSVRDNPYMPRAAQFIEELKKRKGWTDFNPTYLREWCNEWVDDPDALVYRFRPEKNSYRDLPAEKAWNRVMAVDYGYNDQTAFGILSYHPYSPHVYVEHVEGHRGWIPSQIAGRIQQLRDRFKPSKIVADTGALGKMITEEMIRQYGIPMVAAEKKEKQTWISLVNGAFIDQTLLVHESLTELQDQYKALVKDDRGMEHPGLPNDLCDVVLYAFRECRAYLHDPRPKDLGLSEQEHRIWQSIEKDLESKKEDLEWFEQGI